MSMNTPEATALALVAKGAILSTFDSPGWLEPGAAGRDFPAAVPDNPPSSRRDFLVGDLRWLSPDAVFWFTAHGDCADDGHLLTFDRAVTKPDGSISFHRRQQPIAVLSAIDAADVHDADDYRIAFSFWKETGPVIRPLIDRCFESCAFAGPTAAARDASGRDVVVAN
jgi:hypothetical protein